MKYAHTIQITVFATPEEQGEVEKTLIALLDFDPQEEKLAIQHESALGVEKEKIMILRMVFNKERHTSGFLNHLLEKLGPDQKELLCKQAESRLDEALHFFIRLHKSKLLEGEYLVTDSGNCYHINITLAVYPHKRAVALALLHKLFK